MMILAFCTWNVNAAEHNEQKTVIKVAFPEAEGFSMTDSNGVRSGITYDFLTEISKYTGWKYEFIEGDREELLNKMMTGEIDMMGGVYYRDNLAVYLDYPDNNMGNFYHFLFYKKDNSSIKSHNISTINGKTIGIHSSSVKRKERLISYLDYNELDCELIYFDTKQELEDALINEEIDIMLSNDIKNQDKYRVVDKIAGENNFITVSKNSEHIDIMTQLNETLEHIYEADSEFANKLYMKYFQSSYINTLYLDDKEKEYIKNTDTIKVAVMKERYPINYTYKGEQKGIARDIMSLISERTGLSFEYIYADNYQEMLNLVIDGSADITGYFLDDNYIAQDMGLIITKPYISLSELVIKNKNVKSPLKGLTMILPRGKSIPDYIETNNVKYVDNYSQCINVVNKGEADFTCVPAFFMEEIFSKENTSNIMIIADDNAQSHISFALRENSLSELYGIFSKAISNISEEEIANITASNQSSLQDGRLSLRPLIYAYPEVIIATSIIIISLIAAMIIISLRSRMQNTLMTAEMKQVEIASTAKVEFLSRMSHDLRTPMNAIIGLTRLIQMTGETTPSIDDKLEKIDISSSYLLSLLNDILDMSKIESHKMVIFVAPFRINKMVSQLNYMMSMQAEEKTISFEFICETRNSVFVGDVLRIKQVLTNLLSNAIKFTENDGEVILRVKELESKGNNSKLFFSVKDNGIGIKEEDFKKIFEAFEQVNKNEENNQGTGLGLAICNKLVSIMGGELKIKSEAGKGTEFYFELELPIGNEADDLDDTLTQEEIADKIREDEALKGLHLILAEDNKLNAEIIISLFEQKGVTIDYAKNGQEAVFLFKAQPAYYYDAILMDIQMPVMDGMEATRNIRSSGKGDAENILIIALTANTFREDREQAMDAGMTDFVSKPFEMEEIYEIFHKNIKMRNEKSI